jgi:hypothetical protein
MSTTDGDGSTRTGLITDHSQEAGHGQNRDCFQTSSAFGVASTSSAVGSRACFPAAFAAEPGRVPRSRRADAATECASRSARSRRRPPTSVAISSASNAALHVDVACPSPLCRLARLERLRVVLMKGASKPPMAQHAATTSASCKMRRCVGASERHLSEEQRTNASCKMQDVSR